MEEDKAHGGKRKGAGRKTKKEEDKLQSFLSLYEDEVLQEVIKGCRDGDFRFIKIYMEYKYGRPRESKDITTNGESLNFGQISFFDTEDKDS